MEQRLEDRIKQRRELTLYLDHRDIRDITDRYANFFATAVQNGDDKVYHAAEDILRDIQACAMGAKAQTFKLSLAIGTNGFAITYTDRTGAKVNDQNWNLAYMTRVMGALAGDDPNSMWKTFRAVSEHPEIEIEQTQVRMQFVKYGSLAMRETGETKKSEYAGQNA